MTEKSFMIGKKIVVFPKERKVLLFPTGREKNSYRTMSQES